ncbi:MAG TPA: TIGR04283 family arsenosugar biosynthesis glycosyltransferase [Thermoanaerobaculia bacterium]|nr:TIGR04283 family arsenosugar biosynthesis glycosyltransferase [Thermoanaerobaculia bacterium]
METGPLGVAVIVPTLEEEGRIGRLVASLVGEADEVIVTDGGSRDGTAREAEAAGARVVVGPPGRGGQLNRGAARARSPILLFLHADTTLPPGSLGRIRDAVAAGAIGGGFTVRFEGRGWRFALGSWLASRRTRRYRLPLGDQAQFVTRPAFEAVGGFPDWPILEDLEFARRLRKQGLVAILEPPVSTSARRFVAQGPVRTVALNWVIFVGYYLGISPHRLARLYRPAGGRTERDEAVPSPAAPGRSSESLR